MMKYPRIAIIGAGNMGSAIINGLITQSYPPQNIAVSNPTLKKLSLLKKKFKINIFKNNIQAIQNADVILLAVKPQIFSQVALEISNALPHQPLILSIMTGISIPKIAKFFKQKLPIIRTMPNMPAQIGCGITALYANKMCHKKHLDWAKIILGSVGQTIWLKKEKQIDDITALSGSGPAYFYFFMESMIQAAKKMGFSEAMAYELTLETALGATLLALELKKHPKELRQKVTSKGGTTEAAIRHLEQHKFQNILQGAIKAAQQRAVILGKIKTELK